MKDTLIPLAIFSNDPSWSEGSILLEVVLGKSRFKRTAHIEFLVVKANSQYNVILNRSAMMTFGVVTSIVHRMRKFPTPAGIISFTKSSISRSKNYYWKNINERNKRKAIQFLAANIDVFAWQVSDMTGVPRHIAEHKLNVNPNIPPVCQKKRGMAPEWTKFLREEVRNLVEAGILREVKYQTWVANPVMVRKPDNTWRMCVNFTDINKACPKDNYPLPEIDWKMESSSGYQFKPFFNAGATYQRVIDMTFKDQIGRNVEAYVDDIVIKSHTEESCLGIF
ncbi:uncharacterized protein [Rutidosis leptorrhynchoides]|uniref:uncharacterized protein n=1 Tax=Rutidosis leptorrhynchoides TaxID=125765 RepID=UPI003A99D476